MPVEFDRPHIDISGQASVHEYQAPNQNMGSGSAPRVREEHGRLLRVQLRAAFREALEEIPEEFQEEAISGAYYEVQLRRGSKPELLEKKRQSVSLGASKIDDETGTITAVISIPHE